MTSSWRNCNPLHSALHPPTHFHLISMKPTWAPAIVQVQVIFSCLDRNIRSWLKLTLPRDDPPRGHGGQLMKKWIKFSATLTALLEQLACSGKFDFGKQLKLHQRPKHGGSFIAKVIQFFTNFSFILFKFGDDELHWSIHWPYISPGAWTLRRQNQIHWNIFKNQRVVNWRRIFHFLTGTDPDGRRMHPATSQWWEFKCCPFVMFYSLRGGNRTPQWVVQRPACRLYANLSQSYRSGQKYVTQFRNLWPECLHLM